MDFIVFQDLLASGILKVINSESTASERGLAKAEWLAHIVVAYC